MDKKYMQTLGFLYVLETPTSFISAVYWADTFRAADIASTSPKYELGKVAFSSMFLKRKKSQRFGASSFSKCHYTRQKISLPP